MLDSVINGILHCQAACCCGVGVGVGVGVAVVWCGVEWCGVVSKPNRSRRFMLVAQLWRATLHAA